jgi:FkbM family methyltransferase
LNTPLAHPQARLSNPYVVDRLILGIPIRLAIRTHEGRAWYDPPGRQGTLNFDVAELIHCRDLGLAEPGETVLDVGAHHGVLSMYFASRVGPDGHVICVDPIDQNIELIEENIALNRFSNVTAICAAVGDSNRPLQFSLDHAAVDAAGPCCVPQRTLDDIADGPEPGLVKIDVEGYEGAVLRGGSGVLAARPNLMIELHPLFSTERYGDPVDAILGLVDWDAYDAWVLRPQADYALERCTKPEIAPDTPTAWVMARAR